MWFDLKEIQNVEVSGIPTDVKRIRGKAHREGWLSRPRRGRGGGREYHISSLPLAAQRKLSASADASLPSLKTNGDASEGATQTAPSLLWRRWELAASTAQKQAQEKATALIQIRNKPRLTPLQTAIKAAAKHTGISPKTLERLHYRHRNIADDDLAAVCLSRHITGSTNAAITAEAWEQFKSDYLRPERPTVAACYERLRRVAEQRGWAIPSERTFRRWVKSRIPQAARTLAREGEVALRRSYPPLQRDKSELHALEWINGDGYQHNVFVRFPDGRIERPKTWFWQDVYSGKILAHRTAETENSCQIRLAFGDVVERFGIPRHVTIDNTRAAANKWLTGRVPNRYRFKVKESDPLGLLPALGIRVHWTSVVQAGSKARGWGQSKPVERAFGVGGFGESLDKHPGLAGAYTGSDPQSKPENYASKAITYQDFVSIAAAEVAAWNARRHRRTEICGGTRSFDQAFAESYQSTTIRKGTEEQRRMWMLEAESVKVRHDATVVLSAGKVPGFAQNRYHSPLMYDLIGQRVTVRFDPDALHRPVWLYRQTGEIIGAAECLAPVGFGDADAARKVSRARCELVKSTKQMLAAERRMTIEEVGEAVMGASASRQTDKPDTKVVRAAFGEELPTHTPAEAIDWEASIQLREDEEELTDTERLFSVDS